MKRLLANIINFYQSNLKSFSKYVAVHKPEVRKWTTLIVVLTIGTISMWFILGLNYRADVNEAPPSAALPSHGAQLYVYGKVTYPDGSPASGVIIYIGNIGRTINSQGYYSHELPVGTPRSVWFEGPAASYRIIGNSEGNISFSDEGDNFKRDFVIEPVSTSSPAPSPTLAPLQPH